MMNVSEETVWHDDGHIIVLQLNRAELAVQTVICPAGQDGPCRHHSVGCMVDWFVSRFGLECHVGIAPPEQEMRIAWSLSGSQYDLDAAQVWVMSVRDDFFSAWAASQRTDGSGDAG